MHSNLPADYRAERELTAYDERRIEQLAREAALEAGCDDDADGLGPLVLAEGDGLDALELEDITHQTQPGRLTVSGWDFLVSYGGRSVVVYVDADDLEHRDYDY